MDVLDIEHAQLERVAAGSEGCAGPSDGLLGRRRGVRVDLDALLLWA
ncbi:MAG TPA: hypothetical protein VH371_00415 [Candidatus Limnocylindrales bacterium]